MEYLLELEMLGYVAGAMVLGAGIGFDRELADKPAGLRTHMLVAGASARLVGGDPTHMLSAIVIGVGFLGAGTIIRRGGEGPDHEREFHFPLCRPSAPFPTPKLAQ